MSERPNSRSDRKKLYTQGLLKQELCNTFNQSDTKYLILPHPKQPSLASAIYL